MVVYLWILIRFLSYLNQLTSEEAKIIQGKFKMYLNTHLHRLPHGRSQGHPTVQNPLAFLSRIHPLPLHLTVPSRHLISSFQIVSFYQQHPFGTPEIYSSLLTKPLRNSEKISRLDIYRKLSRGNIGSSDINKFLVFNPHPTLDGLKFCPTR